MSTSRMSHVQYHHIGHDPRLGPIALWSMDITGRLHEDRRRFTELGREWLTWSHDNQFVEVKSRALGRVELDRRTGSIHIADPDLARSDAFLCKLLDRLDRQYPGTRWYLFGVGFNGESVVRVLAERAARALAA